MDDMKTYIGCKIIRAKPMDEFTYMREHKGSTPEESQQNRQGYLVTYPDGYTSWSPKDAFETAYREITDEEVCMVK